MSSSEKGPAARAASATPSIDPHTSIGRVRLAVGDLEAVSDFYTRVLGLRILERAGPAACLGSDSEAPLIELVERADAPDRPAGAPGLFHLAILFARRVDLARAVVHATEAGWSFAGASDHLVSEALYLADPEQNGIEMYWDRPKSHWRYVNGDLQMTTRPLDLDGLMSELEGADTENGDARGARIGHVHLRVSDLAAAEAFYHGVLGFEVTVRSYPGALFFSAGGYHHHIGVNTWQTRRDAVAFPQARGLDWFEVALKDGQELARAKERLSAAGSDMQAYEDGVLTADPSGNGVLLRAF